jgi:hypothetical protein
VSVRGFPLLKYTYDKTNRTLALTFESKKKWADWLAKQHDKSAYQTAEASKTSAVLFYHPT